MQTEAIEQRVIELLALTLGVEPSTLQRTSTYGETAGWDSLALVRFMAALEEEYGVSFALDDAEELTSVADAVRVLRDKYI
jgi:acyl carrier protein